MQASGDWSITVVPDSPSAPLAPTGDGDSLFLSDGKAGELSATTDGSGNFAIIEETGKAFDYGLLVDAIGAYSGTVPPFFWSVGHHRDGEPFVGPHCTVTRRDRPSEDRLPS
ncbi:hypothetical protein [Subtercola boreus]|uniref:Uncharacterized protein n=1 Tax=Subtercola boreus TaxID=120213 RepID=A0A3E0WG12_9MICO|nr:hypothetical protein [Subtercola boreus]RFA22776.1 hypothetical protein B7R24_04020 [Subtercola boreus]RFA23131.1 hypothetical protein B7R23_04015 [Subtercola boreus]RFA28884.1 hypothetical protein B7R25_04030 [Subtercola boreus]